MENLTNLLVSKNQSCYVWEISQYEIDYYWYKVNQNGVKTNKLIWTEGWLYHFDNQNFQGWKKQNVYRLMIRRDQKRVMWWFNDYSSIVNDKSKNIFILSDKWKGKKFEFLKELYLKDSGSYQILKTEQCLETLGINCIGSYNFSSKLDYYNSLDVLNETSSSYIIPLQGHIILPIKTVVLGLVKNIYQR